jgi:sugar phosphate isomerase/epimerase
MKFAVCNEMFGKREIEWVFRFAAETGFHGVEIAPFTLAESVVDISPERRMEIRSAAKEAGVEIVGLHWLLVSPKGLYLNSTDKAVRDKTFEYFCGLIDFCGDVGGWVMVVGSPKQRNVPDGVPRDRIWKITKQFFLDCLPVAKKRAVTICIEPLAWEETNFITTAAEGIKLVDEVRSPYFKLHLDVKAMHDEARPIEGIIESSRGYLAHFHANDANRKGPGFGDTDFVPIFRALKETGYSGYVSIEAFDYGPDPLVMAREGLAYLKKCYAGVTG